MSAVFDRLILDYHAALAAHLNELLTNQHLYMDIVLKLAEIQLERHREYYSITHLFLQSDEYGVKWLYCENPASTEKIYLPSDKLILFYRSIEQFTPHRASLYISKLEKYRNKINEVILDLARHFIRYFVWSDSHNIPHDISPEDFISRLDDLKFYAEFFKEVKKATNLEYAKITDLNSLLKGLTLDKLLVPRDILKPHVEINLSQRFRSIEIKSSLIYRSYISENFDQNVEEKVKKGMSKWSAKAACHLEDLTFIKNITKRVSIKLKVDSEKDIDYLHLNEFPFIDDLYILCKI